MIQETCYNCGLPADCSPSEGYRIQITHKAENGFHRDRRRTVWCHSRECAIQALAVAAYGPSTRDWPITLAQFRATHPLELSDRSETIAETRINTGAPEGLFGNPDPEYGQGVSERSRALKTRKGGRPRKWISDAERMRARRRAAEVTSI
jgi:hypothetical protein